MGDVLSAAVESARQFSGVIEDGEFSWFEHVAYLAGHNVVSDVQAREAQVFLRGLIGQAADDNTKAIFRRASQRFGSFIMQSTAPKQDAAGPASIVRFSGLPYITAGVSPRTMSTRKRGGSNSPTLKPGSGETPLQKFVNLEATFDGTLAAVKKLREDPDGDADVIWLAEVFRLAKAGVLESDEARDARDRITKIFGEGDIINFILSTGVLGATDMVAVTDAVKILGYIAGDGEISSTSAIGVKPVPKPDLTPEEIVVLNRAGELLGIYLDSDEGIGGDARDEAGDAALTLVRHLEDFRDRPYVMRDLNGMAGLNTGMLQMDIKEALGMIPKVVDGTEDNELEAALYGTRPILEQFREICAHVIYRTESAMTDLAGDVFDWADSGLDWDPDSAAYTTPASDVPPSTSVADRFSILTSTINSTMWLDSFEDIIKRLNATALIHKVMKDEATRTEMEEALEAVRSIRSGLDSDNPVHVRIQKLLNRAELVLFEMIEEAIVALAKASSGSGSAGGTPQVPPKTTPDGAGPAPNVPEGPVAGTSAEIIAPVDSLPGFARDAVSTFASRTLTIAERVALEMLGPVSEEGDVDAQAEAREAELERIRIQAGVAARSTARVGR